MDRPDLNRQVGGGDDPLVRELTALREENARLRGLLGLDARTAGGNEVAWTPTLLGGPSSGPPVDATAANAIAARDPDTGIVLVATGSYLGEGFDWPELDTLFLAFPLAFKGRVVQYVGRLLRTHAGKHHVELHDYVDSRIPVLDRMHTKRHPAYITLGFDVPTAARRTRRHQPHRRN